MQTLHSLRLPAPAAAGPRAGRTPGPIAALIDAWRRQRTHRATLRTLHSLDDRTLRDLGFHRSEIGAIAAEIGGQAEVTHVRAQMAHPLHA